MRIECPECNTGYKIPDEKVPPKGANIRCKKCQTRFFIKPDNPESDLIESSEQEMTETGPESPPEPSPPQPDRSDDTDKVREPPTDFSEEEEKIDQYVDEGNEEAAAELLFEWIAKSVDARDFPKAEKLLEKMYQVTPMALNEIVKAGELIEEKKSESIDPEHMERWAGLYQDMKEDEIGEFYYAMQKLIVPQGERIYVQGEDNSNLYFVQDGELKAVFHSQKDSSEIDIKTFRPGWVANIDPFFSHALCTASLVAAKDSKLTYLKKSLLEQWKEKLPGVENKIRKFCYTQGTVGDIIKKGGSEINIFKRIRTNLNAMIQLLDESGKPFENPFKISMADISAGGFGYMAKIHRNSDARALLGASLIMQAVLSINDEKKKINVKGKVVAVHIQAFGESSVHIQFQNPVNEKIIDIVSRMESDQ